MQTLIKTTLAAALGLAAVSPAIAGEEPIVVHSQAAMEQWSADVTHSLDRRLANATRQSRINPVSGIVQLRFTLDSDGKPGDIQTVTSSGHNGTDSLAKRAVHGLKQLDDAPVVSTEGQTFMANVIFAKDSEEKAKLAQKLSRMEGTRMALSTSEARVITIGS